MNVFYLLRHLKPKNKALNWTDEALFIFYVSVSNYYTYIKKAPITILGLESKLENNASNGFYL